MFQAYGLENSSPLPRWAVVVCLVAALHSVPAFLVLPLPVLPVPDESIHVDLTDDSTVASLLAANDEKTPLPPETKLAQPPQIVPEPEVAPAQVKPPAPKTPAKVEPPPVPPAAEAKAIAENSKYKPMQLEPLRPQVALDENPNVSAVAPENAQYLSDRNSTAADRGPKNLPRGDPFLDKGQSNLIRYMEKRGEGNLPPLTSDSRSGSVQKEGDPNAGKGIEPRLPDRSEPKLLAVHEEKLDPVRAAAPIPPPAPKVIEKPEPRIVRPLPSGRQVEPNPLSEPDTNKKLGTEKSPDGSEPVGETQPKRPLPPAPKSSEPPTLSPDQNQRPQETPEFPKDPAAKPPDPDADLRAFEARLQAVKNHHGNGGSFGDQIGISGRPGSKGHEGNGETRPGHDEAVSDVTTLNLESSAEEFNDARFSKARDPIVVYLKKVARRIDGKWKAGAIAQMRERLVRGSVTMKVVIRKDGKLLEASEVQRTSGVPDNYVTLPKMAIEQATSPLSEPFTAELADREKIEFHYTFIY